MHPVPCEGVPGRCFSFHFGRTPLPWTPFPPPLTPTHTSTAPAPRGDAAVQSPHFAAFQYRW